MNELVQKPQLHKHSVMQGDFFILSSEKGYAPSQRKEAMQVMECWDNVMTVKCKGGCMTKEYDHFEKVTDLSGFIAIHRYEFEMEDRRSYHPAQRYLYMKRCVNLLVRSGIAGKLHG